MSNSSGSEELFSQRLVSIREMRGLTQTELAKAAGLQPAAVGHFEKDRRKPSFSNIRALAKALSVSADYLLGQTDKLDGATTAFRNEEQLSNADREHIQMMIDLMAKRREQK